MIITKTSEMILYGFEDKIVQLTIITDLERSLSIFDGRGGYSNRDMHQLVLLCSLRESMLVKKKLAAIDPQAFVTVTRVETVWGTGRSFKDIRKDSE